MEKREIIISPKSIKVSDETKLPESVVVSETSPFSDGYDYYGEKERLSLLDESEKILHQDEVDLLNEREKLLRSFIYKRDYFSRLMNVNADSIDISDIEILPKKTIIGKLRNIKEPDSVYLHTRYSTSLWFGHKNQENQRYVGGLFHAARNLTILSRLARYDHFFAQNVLVQVEKEINQLHQLIKNHTTNYNRIIEAYEKNGIKIKIFESEKPRKIEVLMNRYIGNLILLLTQYDRMSRLVITLKEKGLLKDISVLNNIIKDVQTFSENIQDKTDRLIKIESLNRHSLLDNNPAGIVEQVAKAVKEELLPPVSLNVLLMEELPKMVDISNHLSDEEKEKLKQIAIENQLVLIEQ